MRQRVIFYAEPVNEKQVPKSFADNESILAKYMTVEDIKAEKNHWRGPELYEWALYLVRGGEVYPLDFL